MASIVPADPERTTSFMVSGVRFDVPARFELMKPLGRGAYGVVCSAKDLVTDQRVAIKKIPAAFEHLTDAKRTLREIKLLKHLLHENVITLQDVLRPSAYSTFEDVYIVTELMDTDLHQIIGSSQPLSDEHIQYFVYQILRGLKYIHSAHILHRDLKPSNILLNQNCDLKICDFGLARVANPEENFNGFLTEYVATRWYRAPEIMLSWRRYTKAIDVWSVGCILAELLGRKALFPGRNYLDQLQLINNVLGSATDDDLVNVASDKARRYMKSLPRRPRANFKQMFPDSNAMAIDLLDRMLTFNPERRISVDEALEHPYMAALHDPNDEPISDTAFDFSYETHIASKEQLKDLIYLEMVDFQPSFRDRLLEDRRMFLTTGKSIGNGSGGVISQDVDMEVDEEASPDQPAPASLTR